MIFIAKGIELPVNVLILVAIGVIVLIGLVVLLGVGIGGVSPAIIELEKATACGKLVNTYNCNSEPSAISVMNKDRLNGIDNLQRLCETYKGCDRAAVPSACCKINVCGCPGEPVTIATRAS